MGDPQPPGPTAEEKARFLKKIQEWRKLGFNTDELEDLLDNDFNEFLRRRHEVLRYQVGKEESVADVEEKEYLDLETSDKEYPELEKPEPISTTTSVPEYLQVSESIQEHELDELEPDSEEDVLLIGEPIPPEEEGVLEAEEESVIFVGKLPREPLSKVHKTRKLEEPTKPAVEPVEELTQEEEVEEDLAEEELGEDDEELEEEFDDDEDEVVTKKQRRARPAPESVEVRSGSAAGKVGAIAVIIIIILAIYYFGWFLPGATERPEDVKADFEIRPNKTQYSPGSLITLDASQSTGEKLKYQWILDDDFVVYEGTRKSKMLNGYYTATENDVKKKSIILKITGEGGKDDLIKDISVQPTSFSITDERMGDSGEFKVNGYIDISNPEGIIKSDVDESGIKGTATITNIHLKYSTSDSKPMTLELKQASGIEDGFGQKHSVYERAITQELILSGSTTGSFDATELPLNLPGDKYPIYAEIEGSMDSTDNSYTDLKTYNTINGKAINDMEINIPIELAGLQSQEMDLKFSSHDEIESYPNLQRNPKSIRLIDLASGPLNIGEGSGVSIGDIIYWWRAEKIEYIYEKPVIKVNFTINNSTKIRYDLEEFYLLFWIAEGISQPVKSYLYSVNKIGDNTTTLKYNALMTDFSQGTIEISSQNCDVTTTDGHFYKRKPGFQYEPDSNWTYLPPLGNSAKHQGGNTSFDLFTPEQAITIAQQDSGLDDYLNRYNDVYIVSCNFTEKERNYANVLSGEPSWDFIFGVKDSKDGFHILVTKNGVVESEQIEIDEPPNSTTEFKPLLTFAASEDIFSEWDDKDFHQIIFEKGQNAEDWIDFDKVEFGIETNVNYPNMEITSIMFVERSKYAYIATYNEDTNNGQNRVSVAMDAETGQLIFYWDHTDDGLEIF